MYLRNCSKSAGNYTARINLSELTDRRLSVSIFFLKKLTTIRNSLWYSYRLKIEQLMVTQWYAVYTRRYTVGCLVIEQAMASPT